MNQGEIIMEKLKIAKTWPKLYFASNVFLLSSSVEPKAIAIDLSKDNPDLANEQIEAKLVLNVDDMLVYEIDVQQKANELAAKGIAVTAAQIYDIIDNAKVSINRENDSELDLVTDPDLLAKCHAQYQIEQFNAGEDYVLNYYPKLKVSKISLVRNYVEQLARYHGKSDIPVAKADLQNIADYLVKPEIEIYALSNLKGEYFLLLSENYILSEVAQEIKVEKTTVANNDQFITKMQPNTLIKGRIIHEKHLIKKMQYLIADKESNMTYLIDEYLAKNLICRLDKNGQVYFSFPKMNQMWQKRLSNISIKNLKNLRAKDAFIDDGVDRCVTEIMQMQIAAANLNFHLDLHFGVTQDESSVIKSKHAIRPLIESKGLDKMMLHLAPGNDHWYYVNNNQLLDFDYQKDELVPKHKMPRVRTMRFDHYI